MSYSRVVDHRAMIFDNVRNQFYDHAISKTVNQNSVVLDLGCGEGTLLRHRDHRIICGANQESIEGEPVGNGEAGVADGDERISRGPKVDGVLIVDDQHGVAIKIEVQGPPVVGSHPTL